MCEIQYVPMQKPANKNKEILSTAIQKITMNAKEKEKENGNENSQHNREQRLSGDDDEEKKRRLSYWFTYCAS